MCVCVCVCVCVFICVCLCVGMFVGVVVFDVVQGCRIPASYAYYDML